MSTEDVAARIRTRLAAALDHQERGGFVTTLPALCDTTGQPRVPLDQVARIAAQESAPQPAPDPGLG